MKRQNELRIIYGLLTLIWVIGGYFILNKMGLIEKLIYSIRIIF